MFGKNSGTTILIIFTFLLSLSFSSVYSQTEQLEQEYKLIQKTISEKLKSIKSRQEYKKLLQEKQTKLTDLFQSLKKISPNDELILLEGKILFDLQKYDNAREKFIGLIEKNSSLSQQAKFGLVNILLHKGEGEKASALFQEIENKIAKDENFFQAVYLLAFYEKNPKLKEHYSYSYLKSAGTGKHLDSYKADLYANLADLRKQSGQIAQGIKLLEEGKVALTSEKAQKKITFKIKQFKMFDEIAPEISAEEWVNSSSLKLASLKGKIVVIDFWAPWCPPCRRVIPALLENYKKYKSRGLVVLGFTRLYGRYSDDIQDKGQVTPSEENQLIKDFISRKKISYPVAIARKSDIFDTYGVYGIPTMVIIDKKGKIREIEIGSGDKDKLEAKIKNLL